MIKRSPKYPQIKIAISVVLTLSIFLISVAKADDHHVLNGFDLSDFDYPMHDVFQGGPPRDGIPSIDYPKFISAQEANFLSASDKVMGVVRNGVARAYPIRILNWHEVVNDKIKGEYFSVIYCPLCGSGSVIQGGIAGQAFSFGISGLLFDNNVLLYDRNTKSLWSQLLNESVSGQMKGTKLTLLPVTHTLWSDWLAQYPDTEVLSMDTGHDRDYTNNPYEFYEAVGVVNYPQRHHSKEGYHLHEMVLGISMNGVDKAYPYAEVEKNNKASFKDKVGSTTITLHWNAKAKSLYATDEKGEQIPAKYSYWFAWYSFFPDTKIYKAK